MIQRIQSVFLLLLITSMTTFLFVPLWEKTDIETAETHEMYAFVYKVTLENETQANPFPYAVVGALAVLIIVVALIEIGAYKNRVMQLKLGMLNAVLIVASLAVAGYYWYTLGRMVVPHVPVGFGLGLILPAIAMVFNRMALRFIKRDEDLVRSVDRIR